MNMPLVPPCGYSAEIIVNTSVITYCKLYSISAILDLTKFIFFFTGAQENGPGQN